MGCFLSLNKRIEHLLIVTSRILPYSGDTCYRIYCIGDVHVGSRQFEKKRFLEDVALVAADPNGLWIGMGDYLDCIVPSDSKRFRADEIDPEYLAHLSTVGTYQRDRFLEYVSPIADKCLGVLEGNHEESLLKHHHIALVHDLARELKTEYLGNTALLRLTFRRMDDQGQRMRSSTLSIYATHGHSYGRHTGTPLNRLEQTAANFDADIYVAGHCHSLGVSRKQRLSVPEKGTAKLQARAQVFGLTGCYTTSYKQDVSGYAERAGHIPCDVGMLKLTVRPQTLDIRTEI